VSWPEPPFGLSPAGCVVAVAWVTLLPVIATALLARWATAAVRGNPGRRSEVAAAHFRIRRRLGFVHLFALGVSVLGLGWGWTVWHCVVVETAAGSRLAPFAELLVPAPFVIAVALSWLVHFGAERELHRALKQASGQGQMASRKTTRRLVPEPATGHRPPTTPSGPGGATSARRPGCSCCWC
jgi:hypothetical protein